MKSEVGLRWAALRFSGSKNDLNTAGEFMQRQNLGIFMFARKVAFLGEDSRRGDSLSLENLSHRFLKIPRILFYTCDI